MSAHPSYRHRSNLDATWSSFFSLQKPYLITKTLLLLPILYKLVECYATSLTQDSLALSLTTRHTPTAGVGAADTRDGITKLGNIPI